MKRRILREIQLDKIAAVDFPCQEHARVTILKRAKPDTSRLQRGILAAKIAMLKLEMDAIAKGGPGSGPGPGRGNTGPMGGGGGGNRDRVSSNMARQDKARAREDEHRKEQKMHEARQNKLKGNEALRNRIHGNAHKEAADAYAIAADHYGRDRQEMGDAKFKLATRLGHSAWGSRVVKGGPGSGPGPGRGHTGSMGGGAKTKGKGHTHTYHGPAGQAHGLKPGDTFASQGQYEDHTQRDSVGRRRAILAEKTKIGGKVHYIQSQHTMVIKR